MGQLSLLFVVALFLITGVVLYNTAQSADRSDEKVWEHQYRVLARDAASTGMATTARRLGEAVSDPGFTAHAEYPFTAASVAYNGGAYSVETIINQCSVLSNTEFTAALQGLVVAERIEVRSTGTYTAPIGGGSTHRHQMRACYARANWGVFAPPAFNYGFLSDQDATFNGGTFDSLVDGEGHIHTNGDVTIRPNTTISGHVTYTGDDPDIHRNAVIESHGTGATVPMPAFNADQFATEAGISAAACAADPNRCRWSEGFAPGANTTIQPPTFDAGHRADDPFIWYINGNFTLTGTTHITVPQFTIIVVTGNVDIGGSASVTVTGQRAQECSCTNTEWVQAQLLGGDATPLAWYVGNVDGVGGTVNGDVTINGSGSIVGNFYANGEMRLNGGGTGMNTVGSFAAKEGLTVNGGAGATRTNFWFVEVAEKNVVPGISLPGKQIVRVAHAEWTEPVLANIP